MPGKHLLRIDGNERPGAAGQNFTLGIADFSRVDVPSPFDALLLGSDGERLSQRNGLEVLNLHGTGKSQHVAEFIHFAHGFVQDSGDNTAMGVPGRAGVFARKLEMANGLARRFVQRELQAHSLRIIVSAAKAMILARLGFAVDCVAVEDFAIWHLGESNDFSIRECNENL
jgi:hypothetical protein